MYFTNFVKHDGYYESLCSLREELGPILKCRAVKCLGGCYEAIVRDYGTGKMVGSKTGHLTYDMATDTVKLIAFNFVKYETIDYTF